MTLGLPDRTTPRRSAASSHPLLVAICLPFVVGCGQQAAERGAQAAPAQDEHDAEAAPTASEPYANVTAVSVEGSASDYSFSVTVESADIDCSQFADWWEVLSAQGELLYRRVLTHSHTDENGTTDPDAPGNTFTRSGGPVAVDEQQTVYVRAHMNTVGYRGDVRVGNAKDGFALAKDLAPDFAVDVESLDPQPAGCAF